MTEIVAGAAIVMTRGETGRGIETGIGTDEGIETGIGTGGTGIGNKTNIHGEGSVLVRDRHTNMYILFAIYNLLLMNLLQNPTSLCLL